MAVTGDFQEEQRHPLLISQHNSLSSFLDLCYLYDHNQNFIHLHNDSTCAKLPPYLVVSDFQNFKNEKNVFMLMPNIQKVFRMKIGCEATVPRWVSLPFRMAPILLNQIKDEKTCLICFNQNPI